MRTNLQEAGIERCQVRHTIARHVEAAGNWNAPITQKSHQRQLSTFAWDGLVSARGDGVALQNNNHCKVCQTLA